MHCAHTRTYEHTQHTQANSTRTHTCTCVYIRARTLHTHKHIYDPRTHTHISANALHILHAAHIHTRANGAVKAAHGAVKLLTVGPSRFD